MLLLLELAPPKYDDEVDRERRRHEASSLEIMILWVVTA
jgi:hypothetical protein